MKKLKIVFSIGGLYGGGSERQIVSALQHLDRDRFVPHLYVVERNGPLLGQVPQDVPIAAFAERYQGRPFYFPGYMHRQRVLDMARYLREIEADVCYDRTFLMTLISAAAAHRARVANVSTIVTDPIRGFAPVAGRFQNSKRKRLAKLYQQSTQVLAVSSGAADSAAQFYGVPRDIIQVAPNGVDIARVLELAEQPVDDGWWQRPASDSSPKFRMVTAGRLNHEKGFHLLIDATADLCRQNPDRNIQLAILGTGPDEEKLRQQIAALGLQDQIHLPGFCDNAPAWYQSADAFILPSFIEGMPNVLLEAMAVGTPVVSTDCQSGPREILADGKYGLLAEVGSVESIKAGIQAILDNPHEALTRAEAARGHVNSMYSIDVATRRLEDFFTDAYVRQRATR